MQGLVRSPQLDRQKATRQYWVRQTIIHGMMPVVVVLFCMLLQPILTFSEVL